MPRKRERLEVFAVPITKTMRDTIKKIAEAEERRPAEMARRLIAEAIDARSEREISTVAAS